MPSEVRPSFGRSSPVAMRSQMRDVSGAPAHALLRESDATAHALLRESDATAHELLPQYRAAIRSCGGSRWRDALALLRELNEEDVWDSGCTAEVMAACRRGGAWAVSLALLEELRDKGAPPDVYTTSNAIAACEPARLWWRALRLLREQPHPNVVCYNAAMRVCSSVGGWRVALRLLDELERIAVDRGRHSRHERPNARSYTAAITACTRSGAWKTALATWDRMGARGVRADSPAWCAAVTACSEGADATRALRLIGAMRRSGEAADVRVYNAALTACARAKVYQPARRLLMTMRRGGVRPDVRSYNAALAAAAAARRWKPATRMLEEMEGAGVTPDAVSFGTVIAACERARQWRAAQATLRWASDARCADLRAYNSAISAVARGGGWAAALRLVRELEQGRAVRRTRPDARSYGPVILAAARSHQPQVALALVANEMSPPRRKPIPLDPFAGSALIAALGRKAQVRLIQHVPSQSLGRGGGRRREGAQTVADGRRRSKTVEDGSPRVPPAPPFRAHAYPLPAPEISHASQAALSHRQPAPRPLRDSPPQPRRPPPALPLRFLHLRVRVARMQCTSL